MAAACLCIQVSCASLVACHGDTAILSTADFPYEATLVGLHGSLTPDEMLIPLIVS